MRPIAHVAIFRTEKKENTLNTGTVFPTGRIPGTHASNITPNGTVCDHGGQSQFSNTYMGRGNLGTKPTGEPFNPPNTGNRTGEDAGGY